jgi:hypothetical protein
MFVLKSDFFFHWFTFRIRKPFNTVRRIRYQYYRSGVMSMLNTLFYSIPITNLHFQHSDRSVFKHLKLKKKSLSSASNNILYSVRLSIRISLTLYTWKIALPNLPYGEIWTQSKMRIAMFNMIWKKVDRWCLFFWIILFWLPLQFSLTFI